MTVRWKPLLVLSGLFVVIALLGIAAIAATLMPKRSSSILPSARAMRKAGRFDDALVHYQRALQVDGKNPAIHEELAAMCADWVEKAPAEKRPTISRQRYASLAAAAKYDRTLKEPRRQLMEAAMIADETPESVHWAKELLTLVPDDPAAHYAIADAMLGERTPVVPEVQRHLSAIQAGKAPEVRIAWIQARAAQVIGDATARETALAKGRTISLPTDASVIDRTALVQLRALDAESTTDPTLLAERVKALQAEAATLSSGAGAAPNRTVRVSLLLERVQKTLMLLASKSVPSARSAITAQVEAIEGDVEAIFQRSLPEAVRTGLHLHLTYAEHLRFRNRTKRCQEVVAEALKSPLAGLATSYEIVMRLHAVAAEAALVETSDADRFDRAAPHIKELIASTSPRSQGLGHLFQGAIDLERSGVAGNPSDKDGKAQAEAQPRLRTSALNHLKQAAALLPEVVEAQARYGVALVLSGEQALGRQYLQNAVKLGPTDPQYQVWAAWSMVQAGYAEEAEPIVTHLLAEIAAGRLSPDLQPTLHLLAGEISQARRTPEDLRKALAEYERSYTGKTPPPAIQLRMAQIDAQLGQTDRSLQRIEQLRATGQGGTSVEHLAVLVLLETKRKPEALEALAKARQRHPDSDELVGLESELFIKDDKPKEADRVLAAFLEKHPENVGVILMRARVLADLLDNTAEARRLLVNVADRGDSSTPLVQLALLDLKAKDYGAVAATIAKVRARWKEAAVADLLDAQLALDQGKLAAASGHFGKALEKDPGNKVVQFWKAQIDSSLGDRKGAAQALEALSSASSTKELESGVSLTSAARSALANIALQDGQLDMAIRRFEGLRSEKTADMARGDRWRLAAAYAARGQWPDARREIAALLNDPANPPTHDERVQAANFYRLNQEGPAALAQLDYVLAVEPASPRAVVMKAYMLAEANKPADAAGLVRKAIATKSKDKPAAVLFLVLGAMESTLPPADDATKRSLAAFEQGLALHPASLDLVQAKYRLLLASQGAGPAVAYVESAAKDDDSGLITPFLVDVYREQDRLESAEKTLTELVAKRPDEVRLAAALVRVTVLRVSAAADRGDHDAERSLADRGAALVRDFRTRFPAEPVFLEEEFELSMHRADLSRAMAVTKELDQLLKNSPSAPLLRARLYAAQGRTQDVAAAYAEALDRNPAQPEVRILLGQTDLQLARADEALKQARAVLETDGGNADALLLEARALTILPGTPAQQAAARAQAIERLSAALLKQPRFTAAYHQIAEIQASQAQTDAAVATLQKALEAVPDDGMAVARLVELLARPEKPGGTPSPDRMSKLQSVTSDVEKRDTRGSLLLGVAIGYHKAEMFEPALTWIEKAEARLDVPAVHLNHGDILLTLGERTSDTGRARELFQKAVAQYDKVLQSQATSVEAVNNKAWILHSYLGESQKALDLASNFMGRVDPSMLPGEFFDTLGAIQEAAGKTRDAEQSYTMGLRKSPDHPVLNYHMGRLLVTDSDRAGRAVEYLEKAQSGRGHLAPNMAAEVDTLIQRARR